MLNSFEGSALSLDFHRITTDPTVLITAKYLVYNVE